jgi:hypothetical protein
MTDEKTNDAREADSSICKQCSDEEVASMEANLSAMKNLIADIEKVLRHPLEEHEKSVLHQLSEANETYRLTFEIYQENAIKVRKWIYSVIDRYIEDKTESFIENIETTLGQPLEAYARESIMRQPASLFRFMDEYEEIKDDLVRLEKWLVERYTETRYVHMVIDFGESQLIDYIERKTGAILDEEDKEFFLSLPYEAGEFWQEFLAIQDEEWPMIKNWVERLKQRVHVWPRWDWYDSQ